jgi:hypothetical protein
MGAFVMALDLLRARLGCTIIAIHHVGKEAARGGRGHSLLHCDVDTEIKIERRQDGISVATVTKQRDMPAGGEIAFRLWQVELGKDQNGKPVTTCVVVASDWVPPPTEKKGPTKQAKIAFDLLVSAIIAHGETMAWGGRGVSVEKWREVAERSGALGSGGTFRRAWGRTRTNLINDGHIELCGGFAWPAREASDDDDPF